MTRDNRLPLVWLGDAVAAVASDRHTHCRMSPHSTKSTLADDACTQASVIAWLKVLVGGLLILTDDQLSGLRLH
jgi:hypothetical protein